jgi:hypothetical protein
MRQPSAWNNSIVYLLYYSFTSTKEEILKLHDDEAALGLEQ